MLPMSIAVIGISEDAMSVERVMYSKLLESPALIPTIGSPVIISYLPQKLRWCSRRSARCPGE